MEILTNELQLFNGAIFEDGEITETSLSGGVETCTTYVQIVGHPCSHGGEHMPGTPCAPKYQSDAYYSFTFHTICTTEFDYTQPPGNFTGGGSGGVSFTQGFFNSLTQQQKDFINGNAIIKEAIMEHLEQGGSWSLATGVADALRNGIISSQLALDLINIGFDHYSNPLYNYLLANAFSPGSVQIVTKFATFTRESGYRVEFAKRVFIAFEDGSITSDLVFGLLDFGSINLNTAKDLLLYLNQNDYPSHSQQLSEEIIDAALNNNLLGLQPYFKYPPGSNYATLYPNLTEYLKNKIPTLKNNTFIINKLVEYSELPLSQVVNDLQWGQGPTIHITQLDSYGTSTYGLFSSSTPNVLYIDIDYVLMLENSSQGAEGDNLAFLLGVTILHEYVHLGDHVDGVDQPGEEGLLFEQATYGEEIWVDNANNVLIRWQQ